MRGIPLRIELGPRDIENNVCVAVRRDNYEKITVPLDDIANSVSGLLDDVHNGLFAKAKANLDSNTHPVHSLEEAKEVINTKGGFIKMMWCGDLDCELKMKEEVGVSSRCIPFAQEQIGDVCPVCGKPAKHRVIWGIAY